jgi:hypothetical protein
VSEASAILRASATALARRASGNFIGVVLYVPMGGQSTSPWWSMSAFPRSEALEEWYEEIAPSAPLFYYIAAFDKARSSLPVGESIAPPKPGDPDFNLVVTDRWRHSPFKKPIGSPVSGETETRGSSAADIAKTFALFAVFAIPAGLIISKTKERKQLREQKSSFQRLGLDWNQRYR